LLAGRLEDEGRELHVAHPLRTQGDLCGAREDRALDARTAAQPSRADRCSGPASPHARCATDAICCANASYHAHAPLKNRAHALIARQSIQRAHADRFGAGGRRFLDALELRPEPRERLETLLR
jgi:hypothetical protein